MNVSVALCTYNGASFIREQLESITRQTLLPSEIVIGDDASTDNTVAIIQEFASTSPLPIRLERNPMNLGVTRNFESTLRRCRGSVIFTADQDDIWRPDKVERILNVLTTDESVDLVFTDAEIIDADGNSTGRSLWDSMGFDSTRRAMISEGRQFEVLYQNNVVTGATMAFRRKLCDVALPFPEHVQLRPDGWNIIHDGWLALVAASISQVRLVDEKLIQYRRHPNQQIGAPLEQPVIIQPPSPMEGKSIHFWAILWLLEIANRSKSHYTWHNRAMDLIAVYGLTSIKQTRANLEDVETRCRALEIENASIKERVKHLERVLTLRVYRTASYVQRAIDLLRKRETTQ